MMDLVTGATQLHATDVVIVVHEDGTRSCTSFNVFANKTSIAGSHAKVSINGEETRLELIFNSQGIAEFEGGALQPHQDLLHTLQSISEGRNSMQITVNFGGEVCSVTMDMWMWLGGDQVVVVDIDGTITRSDVRGLMATQLQGTAAFLSNALSSSNPRTSDLILSTAQAADYTHDGVAQLLTDIADKGYRMFYLTARPITLAEKTRLFLFSVGRSQGLKLPEGPLVTQEHSTIKALATKHDDFKARVLIELQAVLRGPCGTGRVVAGFGNHASDVCAYSTCGIDNGKIFMIDRSSRITLPLIGNPAGGSPPHFTGYPGLAPHIPALFPPVYKAKSHAAFQPPLPPPGAHRSAAQMNGGGARQRAGAGMEYEQAEQRWMSQGVGSAAGGTSWVPEQQLKQEHSRQSMLNDLVRQQHLQYQQQAERQRQQYVEEQQQLELQRQYHHQQVYQHQQVQGDAPGARAAQDASSRGEGWSNAGRWVEAMLPMGCTAPRNFSKDAASHSPPLPPPPKPPPRASLQGQRIRDDSGEGEGMVPILYSL